MGGLLDCHAGALEDGGDEIWFRKGADERAPAIDDGVRHAANSELSREVRELVRLNADRAYMR